MRLYRLVISLGVLSIFDVSSYTENKCDITIWHMGVMEHLHTQETEMTQRQKSTLEKVEQMMQRVMKNGESPLVNCALLNTYSYNLVAEFSSQLMDLTIRESGGQGDKSVQLLQEQSSDDRKVVNGADDDVGVGPVHNSDDGKEKDNSVKNDDSENKRNNENRIDKQLGTEDIATNIENDRDGVPVVENNDNYDKTEDGADRTIIDDKYDVTRDDVEKKPTDDTSKGDVSESDNSGHRGDNRDTEDENPNDVREAIDGEDIIVLNDPENNIDTARDGEESIRKDSQNKRDADSDNRIPHDTNEENDIRESNQDSDKMNDINTETDVDTINNEIVEDDGKISDRGSSSVMDSEVKSKEGSGKITSNPDKDKNVKEDSHKKDTRNIDNENGFHKNYNDDRDIHKYDDTNNDSVDNDINKERSDAGVNIKRGEDILHDRESKQDKHVFNGDVIKEKGSVDTKLFHGATNDKYKIWEEDDENSDDNEDEDCYYRSADEFVCTRNTRHNNNDKEIKKIANENIEEESDENRDKIVVTDEKIKMSDDDFQTETYENNNDDNRKITLDQDVRVYENVNIDKDENMKKFESSDKVEVDKSESSDQEVKPLLNNNDEDVIKSSDIDEGENFGENIATAKDKSNKDVLDENNKEYSSESLALKDFSMEVAEKSDDINNVIITKGRDKNDGVVMFYDNDDEINDDEEEIKVYGAETFETASKGNEDIESITQESNHESIGSESDRDIKDIDDKNNMDHDNLDINTYEDSSQDVTNVDRDRVLSVNDPRPSISLKQSSDDNEGQATSQQEPFDTSADEKKDKAGEESPEKHTKYKNTARKSASEEISYEEMHTSDDKKMAILNGKGGQSTPDMKQLELIFAQRESEQAAKIQTLELMLVKLENKVLTQSAIKQTDSNVLINLENHILKLENELLKLGQNYQQLVRDHDTLKSQQRKSYLELEHIKTSPRKSEHSSLEDNNTSEMMKQQKSRIGELSRLIHNQSVTAQMLHSRSMHLEEENRRLFQVVLNQTAIISSIMRRLDELGQDGLKVRMQAEDFKVQLETLKAEESLQKSTQEHQTSLKELNNLENDIQKDQSVQKLSKDLDQERQKDQTLLERSNSLEQDTQKDQISLKLSDTLEPDTQKDQTSQAKSDNLLQDTQKDQTSQAKSDNLLQDTQKDKDPLKQPKILPQETQKDLTSLKHSEKLQQQTRNDKASLKQATSEYDFGMDSVKTTLPVKSKDLVSTVLFNFRNSPTANSPSLLLDIRWRCAGQNSTRLCLFCSLIVSNCTPFNNLQWKECKQAPGSLLLELNNEKDLKQKDNIIVHLPSEDDIPVVKNYETVKGEESKMRAPLGESFNEDVGMQPTDRENGERENSIKSESNDELIRQDTKRDKIAGSLRDVSDPIHSGRKNANKIQNDQGRIRDMKVTELDSREDNSRNNGIAFKGGDSNAFDDHRIGDNIESNIQMDIRNMSVQDLPLQTENSATPSGAATTTSLCDHNDQSPECNSKLAETRKPTGDIRTVRHELNEQGELQDLNFNKQEDNKNEYHSTLENTRNLQTAQDNDKKIQMRKKAAEEAMKTHEALSRKILYAPIYDDRPKDCYELLKQGRAHNGLGQIFISGMNVYVTVYCDMSSGGWTILLKREDGLTDFYRDYEQYKEGFGAPSGEHYVGNEVIHHLTNQGHYSLKVNLTDWKGTTRHAHYDHFWVDGEEDEFRLHLFGYSGDAGDGLSKHIGMKFSTFDVDNDLMKTEMGGSCAKRFHGAGWYYKCYSSNLLGRYYSGGQIPNKRFDGIAWKPWRGPGYSLKTVVLAVRPVGAE